MTNAQVSQMVSVAERLCRGDLVEPVTVREFLSWFGAKRRGVWVVSDIRDQLQRAGLSTEPDFESTYIDGPIELHLRSQPIPTPDTNETQHSGSAVPGPILATVELGSAPEAPDPTHRISKLAAANNPPVTVGPESCLSEAVTIMLARGFSQLPVTTSPREVKGVVSWQSIGSRLGIGKSATHVCDAMDQHCEVRHDASIFQAIPLIITNDYVLVRGKNNTVTGIVTSSDLSLQFLQLSEPFLLLSEIENHVRQVIGTRFDATDLASCGDPHDSERKIEGASDLTFGEYIRLLEKPDNWTKLGLPLDRAIFCKQLSQVKDIRNDVMHFDPDGISPADVETLREFARFLQRLSSMGIA